MKQSFFQKYNLPAVSLGQLSTIKTQTMKKVFLIVTFFCITAGKMMAQNQSGQASGKRINKAAQNPATIPATTQISQEKVKIENPNSMAVEREVKVSTGKVKVWLEKGKRSKDDVRTKSTPMTADKCLSKEEVSGQKVEAEIIIAEGEQAGKLMPGLVINANKLLNTGDFIGMKMDKRKPIDLYTNSTVVKKSTATAKPDRNGNIEQELSAALNSIITASNLKGIPNQGSSSEATVSTLNEKTGIDVGASFFYAGIGGKSQFSFSSAKYRYMYLYKFDQVCMAVQAGTISSPDHLFTEPIEMNDEWMYVSEVKYGRRLYVLVECEADLSNFSADLKGAVSWGVISAKMNNHVSNKRLMEKTNIRVYTQGGLPIAVTDKSRVQEELDKYFNQPVKQMDILPLAYSLTNMKGNPVSMVSEVYLNGNKCLTADKIKIRVKSIKVNKSDDSKGNEELYGSASIFYYNEDNKPVMYDGNTPAPPLPIPMPTSAFSYGTKEAPFVINQGHEKTFELNQQGTYTQFLLPSLDRRIKIVPVLKEKDNGLNSDDDYTTTDSFSMTVRDMILKGISIKDFEFRRKEAVITVTFEIIPE